MPETSTKTGIFTVSFGLTTYTFRDNAVWLASVLFFIE